MPQVSYLIPNPVGPIAFSFDLKPTPTARLSPGRANAVTDQIVEDASEIVNGIPEDRAHLDREGFIDPDAVNILSGKRIFLPAHAVRAALAISLHDRVEFLNVSFGPLDFQFRPDEHV